MKHLIMALALTGIAGSALATDAPALPDALLACGNVADAVERAHCYDSQIAALKKAAPATRAAAASTAATVTSPPAGTSTDFTTSQAHNFGKEDLSPERRPAQPIQDTIMHARISGNRSVGPNIWLITLDNGQVWRQDGSPTTMFFKAGDNVTLEKGTLGQYRMTSASLKSKNWLQVTRVK